MSMALIDLVCLRKITPSVVIYFSLQIDFRNVIQSNTFSCWWCVQTHTGDKFNTGSWNFSNNQSNVGQIDAGLQDGFLFLLVRGFVIWFHCWMFGVCWHNLGSNIWKMISCWWLETSLVKEFLKIKETTSFSSSLEGLTLARLFNSKRR